MRYGDLQISDWPYNSDSSCQTKSKPNLNPSSKIPGLDRCLGSEARSTSHRAWQGIGRPPQHAGQHVRNDRALPGLGEREDVWQKDTVSVIHVGGFGSFLWKCYQWWQTLPLDAVSQAPKPPSHVQRRSLAFCQPEAPMGWFAKYRVGREAKVALGSSICALALVYGAATSKNMEKASFGATFCSIPHWWMILKGFCTFVPKNWEVSRKYPCITQAVSRCTIFRAASARMKVPKAPLMLQLGCILTLVIQLATHVLKSSTNSTCGRQQWSPGTGERILVYLLSFWN